MAKKKRNNVRYPLATIIFYGPNDTFATKVAVGILAHEKASAEPLRRWVCVSGDARNDEKIAKEIHAFLLENGVKMSAMSDGIMGCVHEEGLDYPEGTDCPFCPFWAGK